MKNMNILEDTKNSTGEKYGSREWFLTIVAKHKRIGEYLKDDIYGNGLTKSWGKELYDSSNELIDGISLLEGFIEWKNKQELHISVGGTSLYDIQGHYKYLSEDEMYPYYLEHVLKVKQS